MKALALVLPLSLVACAHPAPAPTPVAAPAVDANAQGRADLKLIYAGDVDALWARCSPAYQKRLGSPAPLKSMLDSIHNLGPETLVVSENTKDFKEVVAYSRRAHFANAANDVEIADALNLHNEIEMVAAKPVIEEVPSKYMDYQTHAQLHLPFQGKWTVLWGGLTLKQNYHAAYASQRFAYDILMVQDGKHHTGAGTQNSEYFCFGQPLTAPADGTVVEAVDGIEDNVPGKMNPAQPMGNHVIIDLGSGEFAFIAHLKQGSVAVKNGQHLHLGEAIGQTGNSGNTSEPHVHFHLGNLPDLYKGESLPAQFVAYQADAADVARGMPVQGQVIQAK